MRRSKHSFFRPCLHAHTHNDTDQKKETPWNDNLRRACRKLSLEVSIPVAVEICNPASEQQLSPGDEQVDPEPATQINTLKNGRSKRGSVRA